MKSLIVILTLAVSAQTYASNCEQAVKETDQVVAKEIICDKATDQVLIRGIKIKRFDEEKNFLLRLQTQSGRTNPYSDIERPLNQLCQHFGLKKAIHYSTKSIYSYLETGIMIDFNIDGGRYNPIVREVKQTSKIVPVKEVICN